MNQTQPGIPKKVVSSVLRPIDKFMAMEASSGILLVLVTIVALFWANSPWSEIYTTIVKYPIGFGLGEHIHPHSLQHWVNDGLMVIFFFVVGLEIKRELMLGELSTPRKAALPMMAALGGMVVPALIYVYFNAGLPTASGWGIPMATDIAFAVGIVALMSKKVPFALKVFLLALAIVDDLGAVLVIALFYTSEINAQALGMATFLVVCTLFLKYAGIRNFIPYIVLGVAVWYHVLVSGVHATVAGVILGLITPTAALVTLDDLYGGMKSLIDRVSQGLKKTSATQDMDDQTEAELAQVYDMILETKSPLDRLVHVLHPWVSFLIMPIFAFCNAGVAIPSDFSFGHLATEPVALGIVLGLIVGKPLGVLLFSFIAVKLNFAELPAGTNWRSMAAMGVLAGIGFTMALFVGNLALTDPLYLTESKIAILIGSFFSAAVGIILLVMSPDADTSKSKN